MSVANTVPFREVRLNGWQPEMNDCHCNVDFWIAHNPQSNAVRGWLFWGPNKAGQFIIIAHSILDENGLLIDIAPLDPNTPRDGLLFLKHLGMEEDFSVMKTAHTQVIYPPVTEWQGQNGAIE